MTDSRRTPPPWPEQPRTRPDKLRRPSPWLVVGWVLGSMLLVCGVLYLGLLLLAASHFNTVGGNK
jgi:hypothetical protein